MGTCSSEKATTAMLVAAGLKSKAETLGFHFKESDKNHEKDNLGSIRELQGQ